MKIFLVRCSDCHCEREYLITEDWITTNAENGLTAFKYECSSCGTQELFLCEEKVREILYFGLRPLPDPPKEGPPFTRNDILEFHELLEDQSRFENWFMRLCKETYA